MEITLLIVHAIIALISVAVAAYFYAEARAERRFSTKQSEWLAVEREEKLKWAGTALAKQGARNPFQPPQEKREDPVPKKRIVTRAEAAARSVEYPHVQETIEKAKEILNKS